MEQAKIIGIPTWLIGGNAYGVTLPYANYLSKFGTLRLLTQFEEYDERIDLLVLPGGADVNPERYGQMPAFQTGSPNVFLEYFDLHVLPRYLERGVPIIGICRGMQTLNVYFGGTLTQHLDWHPTSSDPDDVVHSLQFKPEYLHWDKYIKGKGVNSRHHQALNKIGKGFEVVATMKHEKYVSVIPEIIYNAERRIFAVQYHPEDCTNDQLTGQMIRKFLKEEVNA